ncbi:MAG: hypothetical protein VB016_03345 [Methanomassiliicoccaceae archaeon]|nr:hypothetical protein [Methanomassiliicoccaceae archaeon]
MTDHCKVTVDSGVCKMITVINARENEMGLIELAIESDCPHILMMSWHMEPISPYTEVEAPMCETEVYKLVSKYLPHAACPVPCGMVKAIEVAGNLGLKRDVTIKIE